MTERRRIKLTQSSVAGWHYLDVKDAVHTLDRLEVRFERDDEAIQHSKDLAANFRRRHVPNQPGLTIAALAMERGSHREPRPPQTIEE